MRGRDESGVLRTLLNRLDPTVIVNAHFLANVVHEPFAQLRVNLLHANK